MQVCLFFVCWHLVSEGFGVDGIFSSQRDAAEEDEEKDEVCEGGRVDSPVAQLTEPGSKKHSYVNSFISTYFQSHCISTLSTFCHN